MCGCTFRRPLEGRPKLGGGVQMGGHCLGGVYIWEAAAGAAAAAAAYYAPPTPPRPQLLLQRRKQSPKQEPEVTQARPPTDKLKPSGQLTFQAT